MAIYVERRPPRVYGYTVADPADQTALAALHQFMTEHLPGFTPAEVLLDHLAEAARPLTSRRVGVLLNLGLERGDAVVVARLGDFRDTRDCLTQMRSWSQRGIAGHVLNPSLDNVTAQGRQGLALLRAAHNADRERAAERARTSWRRRRSGGKAANQHAGFGFKLAGGKGRRHVVPDPAERAIMSELVRLRDEERLTWDAIYFQFLRDGVRMRSGKEWNRTSLQRAYAAELQLRQAEQGEPACA